MFGITYILLHILLCVFACMLYFHDTSFHVRVWAGITVGILVPLAGVIPFAFLLGYTVWANLCTLLISGGFAAWSWWRFRDKQWLTYDNKAAWIWAASLPLTVLTAYLISTHTFLPDVDGNLFVGQSTYGDLCLHAGFAKNMALQQMWPPDYPVLAGTRLSYPFLSDALSAAMIQMGTSLRTALIFPQVIVCCAAFTGFAVLARQLTRKWGRSILAVYAFFVGSGFGFAYIVDLLRGENSGGIKTLMEGFYKTPSNWPDKGMRFVNIIADMFVPQRTYAFGMAVLLFALWLVYRAYKKNRRRDFVFAGIVAGFMPMIQTHCLMALGFISIFWAFQYLPINWGKLFPWLFGQAQGTEVLSEAGRKRLKPYIINVLLLGGIAIVLAAPQMLYWTMGQVTSGNFITVNLGWVNSTDNHIWFWIKNLGLPLLVAPMAYFGAPKASRKAALPAIFLFAMTLVIKFQPLDYDNNKIMLVAWVLVVIMACDWMGEVYTRIKGMRGRGILAVMVAVVVTLSGVMTLSREAVSRYQIFGHREVEWAQVVRDEPKIETDYLFLCGLQHNQSLVALQGFNMYCGPSLYLHWHGLDFRDREQLVYQYYSNLSRLSTEADEQGIDYLVLSQTDRGWLENESNIVNFNWDEAVEEAKALFPVVMEWEGSYVFAASSRAKESLAGS